MLLKAGGFFFLLSGWAIVLSAVALLGSAAKGGFVAAGLALEIVGLGMSLQAHRAPRGRSR
jgi:hypothetical protein